MLIPTITDLSQDELKLLMILRSMHPYDIVEIKRDFNHVPSMLVLTYTQKEKWPFLTGNDKEVE